MTLQQLLDKYPKAQEGRVELIYYTLLGNQNCKTVYGKEFFDTDLTIDYPELDAATIEERECHDDSEDGDPDKLPSVVYLLDIKLPERKILLEDLQKHISQLYDIRQSYYTLNCDYISMKNLEYSLKSLVDQLRHFKTFPNCGGYKYKPPTYLSGHFGVFIPRHVDDKNGFLTPVYAAISMLVLDNEYHLEDIKTGVLDERLTAIFKHYYDTDAPTRDICDFLDIEYDDSDDKTDDDILSEVELPDWSEVWEEGVCQQIIDLFNNRHCEYVLAAAASSNFEVVHRTYDRLCKEFLTCQLRYITCNLTTNAVETFIIYNNKEEK